MTDLVKAIKEAASKAEKDWWFQKAEPADALEERITKAALRAIDEAGYRVLSLEDIEQYGEMGDFCVFNVTGRTCPYCYCERRNDLPDAEDVRGILAAAPDVTGDEG